MKKLFATTGLIFLLTTGLARGDGFGINVTRVIFKGSNDSAMVTLRNTSSHETFIVQTRISKTVDGFESTPFTITPPIFRLDSNSTNNLRIQLGNRNSLQKDRESVFYLNSRAIPASMQKEPDSDARHISGTAAFGVGTIIKLFFRPEGLPGSAESAQQDLVFTAAENGIKVRNNSAYHVSFASLSIAGEPLLINHAPTMLAPYSEYVYASGKKHGRIAWATINDFGGKNAHTTDL